MTDAKGNLIQIGSRVRFAEDRQRSWNLGQVVAIMDDENVVLTGPIFRTAKCWNLIVMEPTE